MNEELETIEQIREFKNTGTPASRAEREEIFLTGLKQKLVLHISQNPVKINPIKNLWQNLMEETTVFADIKKAGMFKNVYAGAAALSILALIFSTGGIIFASQNSLPGENLYPVKILGEELRSTLTISPAEKARLETEFAAKRIEEIKMVIQKNGPESESIDTALEHLQQNTAKAANIIDKEKQKGNEITELADDINKRVDNNQEKFNNVLNEQITNVEKQKESLNDKIDEAKTNGNASLTDSLTTELLNAETQKKALETNRDKGNDLLNSESENIHKNIEENKQKQEDLKKAENTPTNIITPAPSIRIDKNREEKDNIPAATPGTQTENNTTINTPTPTPDIRTNRDREEESDNRQTRDSRD